MSLDTLLPGIDINLDLLVPTERKKAMLSELGRLDNEWKEKTKVEIPEVERYERKEEKVIDTESIKKDVLEDRSFNYDKKVGEMESKSVAQQDKKASEIDKVKSDFVESESDVLSGYEYSKKALSDDMIDRGLSRSSIKSESEKGLLESVSQNLAELKKVSEDKVGSLQMEIDLLKSQLESDLESFRISEAIKVQDEIDKIVQKLTAENEKIKEYNDKLTQKEAESERKRSEAMLKAEEARIKEAEQDALYGYRGEKAENYYKRLEVAKKYYGSIPKEQALEELKKDVDTRNYLGLYYNKLLAYLYQR